MAAPVRVESTQARRQADLASDPATPAMVDGLAEEFRHSRSPAGPGEDSVQPSYPQVPAGAVMLAAVAPSETYGTGAQANAQRSHSQ